LARGARLHVPIKFAHWRWTASTFSRSVPLQNRAP